jgi:hypothetical protein
VAKCGGGGKKDSAVCVCECVFVRVCVRMYIVDGWAYASDLHGSCKIYNKC